MSILIVFAFIAGVVTILSPCILPILPIILSSSVGNSGKKRPLGIVTGFILSFTFFTLFLSSIVKLTGISADLLRNLSVFILAGFGISLLIPQIQFFMEKKFSSLASLAPRGQKVGGFLGGLTIGLSLGLLWTPCVGPILASVISLALSGTVTSEAVFITLAYSAGTAIPMFLIIMAGSTALQKVPWLLKNTSRIQKAFGILMIITAVGIFFGYDRKIQSYIIEKFPNYGTGLTQLEDIDIVDEQLDQINKKEKKNNKSGEKVNQIAPDIQTQGKWFNLPSGTDSLNLSELKGKVVLIDFWTYSCINCQRTLPYLKTWWEKYEDKGLVIIGVHSPEFEFEKNPENVQEAIEDFEIKYPVVQDNDFKTWRAYENRYWPAKYLIDKDGFIRYTHFGEGKYDETENTIQELLAESGSDVSKINVNNPTYERNKKTPETYFGHARIENFASPENVLEDATMQYSFPENLPEDFWALEGNWEVRDEYIVPSKGAKLRMNFQAEKVFMVARTVSKDSSVSEVTLTIDQNAIMNNAQDVKENTLRIEKDKLYEIVDIKTPSRHTLELEFTDANVELYTFTFG